MDVEKLLTSIDFSKMSKVRRPLKEDLWNRKTELLGFDELDEVTAAYGLPKNRLPKNPL